MAGDLPLTDDEDDEEEPPQARLRMLFKVPGLGLGFGGARPQIKDSRL